MNVTRYETREQWEAARNAGGLLGGSSIAAIVGRHPHRSEWSVWMEATGQGEPREDSPRLRMGRRLEPAVLDEWEHINAPLTLVRRPFDLYRHPLHPWAVATLDGVFIDGGRPAGVVEAKTVCAHRERFGWGAPGVVRVDSTSDLDAGIDRLPIPAHYMLQCVWQMVVTGLDECRLVALFGSDLDGVREWRIPRPAWLCIALLSAADTWYHRHIARREPPAVDGSDDCARFYRRTIPANGDRERVDAPSDELESVRLDYESAAADAKRAEARRALARNRLLAAGLEPQNVRGTIRLTRRVAADREVA